MTGRARTAVLPGLALVLVSGVLTIQLANGGGTFEPLRPADPCTERVIVSQSSGIDALTEILVLRGLDNAACRLGTSREALTLDIAQSRDRSDAEIDALRRGLTEAIGQMEADGSLPPASEFVEESLDNADLNRFLEAAIRALPESFIDSALKTDDVLVRAIADLDLRTVLANLDNQRDLNAQIEAAITQAVKDSLAARVRGLV